jgi:hypothetical protein
LTLSLKELLGNIRLEPIADKESDIYSLINSSQSEFKPYYVAHTKINTLALLDDRDKGANWYYWRRK